MYVYFYQLFHIVIYVRLYYNSRQQEKQRPTTSAADLENLIREVKVMLTDFGYIGKVDGIEYATETEAKEANKDNTTRAARPPPFLY